MAVNTTGRSAPKVSANRERLPCRRPSPTRLRMRSEFASVNCRSPPRPCIERCAPPLIVRLRTREMTVSQPTIRFTLNGQQVSVEIDMHWNLIDLLQRKFDLFGARESCAQGLCGCCTVLVNGKAVSGCLYFAVRADGTHITTIEHLGPAQALDH